MRSRRSLKKAFFLKARSLPNQTQCISICGRTRKPDSPPVLLNVVPISGNSALESGTNTSVSLTSGSPSVPDSLPRSLHLSVRLLSQESVSCHCRSTSQETTIQLCDPWMFQHRPAVRTFLFCVNSKGSLSSPNCSLLHLRRKRCWQRGSSGGS